MQKAVSTLITLVALSFSGTFALHAQSQPSFQSFDEKASQFNEVLTLPEWETTPDALRAHVKEAMSQADAALDRIGHLSTNAVTFDNTVRALDDIAYTAGLPADRAALIKETSPDPVMRDAATEMIKLYEAWAVGLEYREDVYRAIRAYADQHPPLDVEDSRLLEETLRDYRRAGLSLPKDQRAEVELLRKELTRLTTDFDTHVTDARKPVRFTKKELDGVPESFLEESNVKTGDDEYTVMANITWHYIAVEENARNPETRRRLLIARFNLAKEENIPLLNHILEVRNAIAHQLGYDSWADYQIEPKMAKDAATARDFLLKLKDGLEPKFQQELAEFARLKAKETGESNPRIELWDWRYYSNQLKKDRYTIDTEQLRVFFPYQRVLQGMFGVFEQIFGLRIQRVAAPYTWVSDLQLYVISDSNTGEPLGALYLDMFPREGKYNHFAQFGIVPGKELPDGRYRRPVVALICNFPSPQPDHPSLLTHDNVETLFHEFGHALHSILTRAHYRRFSGTSVPRDFVEAPSQMLENWAWNKQVLDSFAADYRDPSRKIPQEILDKMQAAKLATIGTFYRRQLSFGLLDLALHESHPAGQPIDSVKISNRIISDVFLPVPDDTAFVAYFGHLTGYDAGYYGYAWADAIAADMNTVFKNAGNHYFDRDAGRRLRQEIYSQGDSRDVAVSIRRFLGRERSIEPFLEQIGIGKTKAPGH